MTIHIIGAGLAGLITACKFKDAEIYESCTRMQQHRALLRFRTLDVSNLTGIPFKEVTVHKEIDYYGKTYRQCTIEFANRYSRKVSGALGSHSIWDLDTVNRYIAPPNFYDILVDRHAARIAWETPMEPGDIRRGNHHKFINTSPLPVIMDVCGLEKVSFDFRKKAIRVDRYALPPGTDIFQTVYFPEETLRTFRASITGDVLIVESMVSEDDGYLWRLDENLEFYAVLEAFGLDGLSTEIREKKIDSTPQKYGKIVPLPHEQREAILYELTREFNVFSIGRFATWRNILLDDLVNDIYVVDRLLAASAYGRELVLANRS
jgi:hypothetical protein